MVTTIDGIVTLAERAGEEILRHYQSDAPVRLKDDRSPLTVADEASHGCIVAGLAELDPGIPFSGAKQSGVGTELGREGLEEFTQRRVINIST